MWDESRWDQQVLCIRTITADPWNEEPVLGSGYRHARKDEILHDLGLLEPEPQDKTQAGNCVLAVPQCRAHRMLGSISSNYTITSNYTIQRL